MEPEDGKRRKNRKEDIHSLMLQVQKRLMEAAKMERKRLRLPNTKKKRHSSLRSSRFIGVNSNAELLVQFLICFFFLN